VPTKPKYCTTGSETSNPCQGLATRYCAYTDQWLCEECEAICLECNTDVSNDEWNWVNR